MPKSQENTLICTEGTPVNLYELVPRHHTMHEEWPLQTMFLITQVT